MKLNFFGSLVVIIVLTIATISFIWIPAMGGFGSVKTLASWDGHAITNEPDSPFFENMQRVQRLFESFVGNVPQDAASQEYLNYKITNIAMTASIVDTAMKSEVEKNGYRPSDKLINLQLINQFSDPNTGLYSPQAYQNTSEANKLKIRTNIVSDLTKTRYIQDLFGFNGAYGLKTNSKETEFLKSLNSEKRTIRYINFNTMLFPQEKIKSYAEEHADLFVKHDLSVVSFQDEKAASTVFGEISKGTVNFDDAFKNQDVNATNPAVNTDGKLINAYRKDLNALFPNAEDLAKIVALKVGEVSKPVKMNSLFVVLKCNADPVQPDFSSKALLNEVFYYMRQYERGVIEDYLVAHAEDFRKLAQEKTFDDACREFDVQAKTVESLPINYGNSFFLPTFPTGDPILSTAISNEDFFKTIFSLQEHEVSKPFLLNDNAVVCTVTERIPADTKLADSTVEMYKQENQNWTDYYMLALLTTQYPIPLAQSTVLDFITKNPKTKNDLYKFTK